MTLSKGWNMWQKYQTYSKPTFFCSSVVTSEPTYLHHQETEFEATTTKKDFFCININRTTKWSLQVEIFTHFLCFLANLHLCCPLRLWMNELWKFIYSTLKLPHKTLCFHSTRYTQCIHVSSHKLKLQKDIQINKVPTATTHLPPSENATIHKS